MNATPEYIPLPEELPELAHTSLAKLAEAIIALGELLWIACLGPTPMQDAIFRWMSKPRFGDLVMVGATRGQNALDRVGVYDSAWTFIFPDDSAVPYADRATEDVHLIATLDGRWVKWTDMDLRRIPRNPHERREARTVTELGRFR